MGGVLQYSERMTTLFISHSDCDDHINPPGHPEQVARLNHIRRALSADTFADLKRWDAQECEDSDILLCHPEHHLNQITLAEPMSGWSNLDGDTFMTKGSVRAARLAVGGNVAAVDAVLDGQVQNAFVACRPPGHHAETATAMGFCLFGNVAIAAKHALTRHGLSRVAIIDFDVHHGNGTQDLMWEEAGCLFASTHQMPLYPGSGAPSETGAHNNILNVPLAAGSGSTAMRDAYDTMILLRVQDFEPELILISAGFDAHRADPLANLMWVAEDFAWLTRRICEVAAETSQGRVVSTLEGGYDLDALAASAAAHVQVLMEQGA